VHSVLGHPYERGAGESAAAHRGLFGTGPRKIIPLMSHTVEGHSHQPVTRFNVCSATHLNSTVDLHL